jgi:hypothetical protein
MTSPTHRTVVTTRPVTSSGTLCVTYICALTCVRLTWRERLAWRLRRLAHR